MPGFYELEDDTDMGAAAAIDAVDQAAASAGIGGDGPAVAGPSRLRPPVSDPVRTASAQTTTSGEALSAGSKPRSTSNAQITQVTHNSPTSLECPICNKMLETDNQGLNAHIDFCLSKGAIMAAQVKASPAKGFKSWEKGSTAQKRKR